MLALLPACGTVGSSPATESARAPRISLRAVFLLVKEEDGDTPPRKGPCDSRSGYRRRVNADSLFLGSSPKPTQTRVVVKIVVRTFWMAKTKSSGEQKGPESNASMAPRRLWIRKED